MFIILDYSSALEYSIIRRYTNIVYYYYYYVSRKTPVYVLLIDASKAFDRVKSY